MTKPTEDTMSEPIHQSRRLFLGAAAASVAAASLVAITSAFARGGPPRPQVPFGPVKQIDAGLLNVGYVELGPPDGKPVLLVHGWPYDIHSYGDVAPILATIDASDPLVRRALRG